MNIPARRVRLGIGLGCMLVCLGVYGYWGVWLPLHAAGYDLTGPYEAAYALAHHAPLRVYDVPAQRAYNDAVLHLPDGPSDFRWTPPSAVLLIPLALLPYWTARTFWWALSQVALVASLWLLARSAVAVYGKGTDSRLKLPSTRMMFLVLFCAAAIAQPVTDSLRLGQSTTILLFGFALITYGEVFDQQWLGGVGLGIAILDKLFPGALLLFFLWRGRYRLCAVAVGLVALLVLVALPVTGLGMYGAFAQALHTYSNTPNAGPVNLSPYHGLIVALSAILWPGQPEPSAGVAQVVAMLICGALFGIMLLAQGWPDVIRWMRWAGRTLHGEDASGIAYPSGASSEDASDGQRQRLLMVSWAVCSLLVVEPIDWIFYYLLLLVPLAWLLTRPDRAAGVRWGALGGAYRRWWLAALLAYVVATMPLPLDSRAATPMGPAFVAGICVRPAALLVLWAAHAAFAFGRQGRPATVILPVWEALGQSEATEMTEAPEGVG